MYTSTHPLGHTGPVTESLYLYMYVCICVYIYIYIYIYISCLTSSLRPVFKVLFPIFGVISNLCDLVGSSEMKIDLCHKT